MPEQLVGVWKLISVEQRSEDGQVSYPLGRRVAGQLIYDEKGNLSVQCMRAERPKFASGDSRNGTPEEVRAAFEGYMAYFGTYRVDAEQGTVVHHVTGNVFPNWVGMDYVRHYRLSGSRLTLRTPPIFMGGRHVTGEFVWERLG